MLYFDNYLERTGIVPNPQRLVLASLCWVRRSIYYNLDSTDLLLRFLSKETISSNFLEFQLISNTQKIVRIPSTFWLCNLLSTCRYISHYMHRIKACIFTPQVYYTYNKTVTFHTYILHPHSKILYLLYL